MSVPRRNGRSGRDGRDGLGRSRFGRTGSRRGRLGRTGRRPLPFPAFLLAVCAAVTVGATSVRALAGGAGSGGAAGGAGAALAGTAQRLMAFLDYFAGVFTLLALTAAVVCGLAAADRLVLTPRLRLAAQAVHRAASVAALGFLATHVAVKLAEKDATPLAALLPFGGGSTFAVGLGTLAADLLVVAAATGAVRGRFAGGRRPGIWRVLHASAYGCWTLALVHGLTAGRAAAQWVLWSYGVCAALIALALLARTLRTTERLSPGLRAHAPEPPTRAALAALAALSREHEPIPYAAHAHEAEPVAASRVQAQASPGSPGTGPAGARSQACAPVTDIPPGGVDVAGLDAWPWQEAWAQPAPQTPPYGVALPPEFWADAVRPTAPAADEGSGRPGGALADEWWAAPQGPGR